MKKITSTNNAVFKNAVRLKTGRGRKSQQRVIIFGLREVRRAIQCGLIPLEVFVCSDTIDEQELNELQNILSHETEVLDLTETLMCQLKYGERIDEVVAIVTRPETMLEELNDRMPNEKPLIVILESIEKPGNIGAVLRSMDAVGASALILAAPQCDVFHPNCIRSSMGSVFTLPIAIGASHDVMKWCKQRGVNVLAATDSAKSEYTDCDLTEPIAIAFGNEANGLSNAWLADEGSTISIPMRGISDSLNISVAAGVILFEALRQRNL